MAGSAPVGPQIQAKPMDTAAVKVTAAPTLAALGKAQPATVPVAQAAANAPGAPAKPAPLQATIPVSVNIDGQKVGEAVAKYNQDQSARGLQPTAPAG